MLMDCAEEQGDMTKEQAAAARRVRQRPKTRQEEERRMADERECGHQHNERLQRDREQRLATRKSAEDAAEEKITELDGNREPEESRPVNIDRPIQERVDTGDNTQASGEWWMEQMLPLISELKVVMKTTATMREKPRNRREGTGWTNTSRHPQSQKW
jgi:hypothetical protein